MCFVDTTRLCSTRTEVRWVWIITYSRPRARVDHSDQANVGQVHPSTNACQRNQSRKQYDNCSLCSLYNAQLLANLANATILGTCPRISTFHGSNFIINGHVNRQKC
jgi:hypothetical protein